MSNPFDFNQQPAQVMLPTVVEERADAAGVTWQKMSDGTVRQKPLEAAQLGAPWPGAVAGPVPGTVQQPLPAPGQAAQPWAAPPNAGGAPWGGQAGGAPPQQVTQRQPIPEYVDIDEQVAGFKPPIGTFDVRLATCEGARSQATSINKDTGEPWRMVKLTLEIVAGRDSAGTDVTGREIRHSYLLDPRFDPKRNRWNAGGVAEIRDDLLKSGAPAFPQGYRFPTNEMDAARIVAQGLGGGRVFRVMTVEETKTKKGANGAPDQTRTNTRVRFVGPAGASVVAAAGVGGGLAGFAPPS